MDTEDAMTETASTSNGNLKGKRIRFGGPSLLKGAETWYDHMNPDGTKHATVFVRPGQEIDADRVDNVQHYIDNGLATVVEPKA
jgi:hypothetical protein